MKALPLDYLPQTARDLINLVGMVATMRLIQHRGGRTLDVRKLDPGFRRDLAEIVGGVAADKIIAHYGGGPLIVPLCKRAMLAASDAAMQARFDELTNGGRSARCAVAMIAGEFGCTDRTVWTVLKRDAGDAAIARQVEDSTQTSLFV